MKVFYLPGAYDGCYYYRGYLPGVHSDQLVITDFIKKELDKKELLRKSLESDVIVIQRPNDPKRYELAKMLKAKGKKIIFENDDTYLPDKGVPLCMLGSDRQREIAIQMNDYLYKTLEIADGVIASTEALAEEYRGVNKNVAVCKNCIDPLDEIPCKENRTEKFRVGFIGSVTSNDDYTHIKDQIRKLDGRGDVTIVVFGIKRTDESVGAGYKNDHDFWSSLKNVEWQPFVPMTDYYMTIANLALDLVIIPRKQSYFNRCKSNLKFLEMSLLRIPVLAQGFTDRKGPYDSESDYMTVVYDDAEWHDRIVQIKNDYQKYKRLAIKAHDYVLANYNINEYSKEWQKTIERLLK